MQNKKTIKTAGPLVAVATILLALATPSGAQDVPVLPLPDPDGDTCGSIDIETNTYTEATCANNDDCYSDGVVLVLYKHKDYGRPCLSFTTSGTCHGGVNLVYGNLADADFNDDTSSADVTAYANTLGCHAVILFEHAEYLGASITCTEECSYVGDAMNDETSSLRITA